MNPLATPVHPSGPVLKGKIVLFHAYYANGRILRAHQSVQTGDDGGGEVTALLRAWSAGDRSVEERLFELVLPDLHKIAAALMHKERADHSYQPTALLNETYVRLVGARENDWENRRHFFAVAARAMRHFLVDHARGRPKGAKVSIDGME